VERLCGVTEEESSAYDKPPPRNSWRTPRTELGEGMVTHLDWSRMGEAALVGSSSPVRATLR